MKLAVGFHVYLISCGLVLLVGCSDPQGEQRVAICKAAGVAGDLLKTCKRSWLEYNRIMEPISAQRDREEVAAFNEVLHALPSRTAPKEMYETISLEKLNKEDSDSDVIKESQIPLHPLFGKRFRVHGEIHYHPTDRENKMEGYISLEDETNGFFDVDIESLSREERAFIETECEFDGCRGEFFGVMGVIHRDRLESLGLRIEYVQIDQRDLKKSS